MLDQARKLNFHHMLIYSSFINVVLVNPGILARHLRNNKCARELSSVFMIYRAHPCFSLVVLIISHNKSAIRSFAVLLNWLPEVVVCLSFAKHASASNVAYPDSTTWPSFTRDKKMPEPHHGHLDSLNHVCCFLVIGGGSVYILWILCLVSFLVCQNKRTPLLLYLPLQGVAIIKW